MKWFKAAAITVAVAGGIFGLMNCGDGNPTGAALSETSIVGLWNISAFNSHLAMTVNGLIITKDTSMTLTGINTVEFFSDHRFVSVSGHFNDILGVGAKVLTKNAVSAAVLDTARGNWSLSGDTLTFVITQPIADTILGNVSISGNSLTWTTLIAMSVSWGATAYAANGSEIVHLVK
jgi:hypothetical protein